MALVSVYVWKKNMTSPAQVAVTTTNSSGATHTTQVTNNDDAIAFVRKASGTVEISNTAGTTNAAANSPVKA